MLADLGCSHLLGRCFAAVSSTPDCTFFPFRVRFPLPFTVAFFFVEDLGAVWAERALLLAGFSSSGTARRRSDEVRWPRGVELLPDPRKAELKGISVAD